MNNAVKVGIAVLAAFAILMYATFSLRRVAGGKTYLQKVTFPTAQGVQEGAFVRVLGVNKGTVEDVALGSRREAVLTLRMSSDYRIQPDDAIRIVGGLFSFAPPYVEITPGGRRTALQAGPDNTLSGEPTPSMDTVMAQSDELLRRLNKLTARATVLTEGLVDLASNKKLRRNFVELTANLTEASRAGKVIARNMVGVTEKADRLLGGFSGTAGSLNRTLAQSQELMRSFRGTAGDMHRLVGDSRALVADTRAVVKDTGTLVHTSTRVIENAGGLVTETRGTLSENRERIAALFENLNHSLKNLDETLEQTKGFLGDPELRTNLKATAANLKDATENLKGIARDVRGLTSDPKVQEDLRATLSNLRDVSESANQVLQRATRVLGTSGKTAKTVGQKISEASLDITGQRGFRSANTRLDLNAMIPWSSTTFYRLGFYDFGESNRFTVQAGQTLRPGISARGGFYASKLGVGLDFGAATKPAFSFDLFGIDKPRLDARTNLSLAPHFDLRLGLENIFRKPDPVLGVRYVR